MKFSIHGIKNIFKPWKKILITIFFIYYRSSFSCLYFPNEEFLFLFVKRESALYFVLSKSEPLNEHRNNIYLRFTLMCGYLIYRNLLPSVASPFSWWRTSSSTNWMTAGRKGEIILFLFQKQLLSVDYHK